MAPTQPWMKFYPSDWRADQALRICSIGARGLWLECMCIMHEAVPYGQLVINGRPVTDTQLASLTGVGLDLLADLVSELEDAGVFSRTAEGVIYSRRMIRDEKRARLARKNGKTGGNPNLCKQRPNPPPVNPPDKGSDKGQDKTQRPEARESESDSTFRVQESESQTRTQHCPTRPPDGDPPDDAGKSSAKGRFVELKRLPRAGPDYAYPAEFRRFWDGYPKRATDTPAKAYPPWRIRANDPRIGCAMLQDGAERYADFIDRTGHEPKLVSTWMNDQGWTASLEKTQGNRRGKSIFARYADAHGPGWQGSILDISDIVGENRPDSPSAAARGDPAQPAVDDRPGAARDELPGHGRQARPVRGR